MGINGLTEFRHYDCVPSVYVLPGLEQKRVSLGIHFIQCKHLCCKHIEAALWNARGKKR